ncbi:MAG: DUF4838 domain-containing protein [Candidatus Sumerlaeota bacterium]|nr:DUF4838 domain-containing protein [Candidatus Sumerlaeota bacterium]
MTDWYKCAGLFSCVAILSFGAKSLAASEEAASDVLIENGVAKATIVIPANPGAVERWAANDLQYVLEKMSGAKLPIVEDSADIQGNRVLIGETRFTDAIIPREEREAMGKEGYVVRLRGRDLACAGGGPYGHMYAVDELYDRLGVRFYMPGPLGECIPKCDTVRFDEFEAKRWPSFAMRWISRDTQWNLRNRTNRMEDETLPPAFGVLPSLYHSQSKLLPQSQYLKTHPEYYAWDGKKRPAGGGNAKLCNSNPDVPKELAKNMAKIIRQNPGVDLIALSPTDGQDWCQCDECKALDDAAFVKEGETVPRDQTYSRRQMILYNRVAEELKKVFPNQTILAGAYNLYTWPPLDPSIHANRNLAIIVCHYQPGSACLMHPIEDPDCGPNARYLEILRAWQKQTPRIYFYEYYWKVNWLDLPWAIAHTVAADIKFYKANGFEGVSTQHSPHAVWGDFIPMYVAARMLWDDAVDAKALVDELYKNFYGEAAEPMRRFHEAIERQMAESKTHITTPRRRPKARRDRTCSSRPSFKAMRCATTCSSARVTTTAWCRAPISAQLTTMVARSAAGARRWLTPGRSIRRSIPRKAPRRRARESVRVAPAFQRKRRIHARDCVAVPMAARRKRLRRRDRGVGEQVPLRAVRRRWLVRHHGQQFRRGASRSGVGRGSAFAPRLPRRRGQRGGVRPPRCLGTVTKHIPARGTLGRRA